MNTAGRLQTKGLAVNLRVEGQGPNLLFLGGSSFDLSVNPRVFSSALVDHFTVAAADPRGLGATDAPDGDWHMQDYAQDALDVLDALGWNTAFVLGESFGAMTALHLADAAPGRLRGLALCGGSSGGAGGSSYPIQTLRDIPDAKTRAARALEIMDARFEALRVADPDEAMARIEARVAAEAAFLANGDNAKNYPRLLAARAGHNAWDALKTIVTPSHVFAGQYDRQAPLDNAAKMAGAMPNATLHIIEGGHSICFATVVVVDTLIQLWTT